MDRRLPPLGHFAVTRRADAARQGRPGEGWPLSSNSGSKYSGSAASIAARLRQTFLDIGRTVASAASGRADRR